MLLAPILACLIFPLDNTRAHAKISQILSSYIFPNFGDGIVSGIILTLICNLLFIKRPFGLFDTSVSGIHPTFGGSSGLITTVIVCFRTLKVYQFVYRVSTRGKLSTLMIILRYILTCKSVLY